MSAVAEPARVEAHEPPEERGSGRDDVAMLVAMRGDGSLVDARFRELPGFLASGDLLVVNTSATVPAALEARIGDRPLTLHLSSPAPDGNWIVELREGLRPYRRPRTGTRITLPAGAHADVLAPYAGGDRLALARLELGAPLEEYLRRHGRPIRYRHAPQPRPLADYQTIFARDPGSAEMPSAARPFTPELVTELVSAGVLIAPITLHAGVSSPERGEPPQPERYRVPETTARLVNVVHLWGGRVIAVGTTVVRALETVAAPDGTVDAAAGWTSLVVTPERGLRTVDGLLTGWHEPESSHLQMLEASAGAGLLDRSYRAAEARAYRWHEFGDLHLILP